MRLAVASEAFRGEGSILSGIRNQKYGACNNIGLCTKNETKSHSGQLLVSKLPLFSQLGAGERCIESGKEGRQDQMRMLNTLLTLFDTDRCEEYYRTGFWRDDTVYALVRAHADRTPDRIAVRSAHHDLTYRALLMH